MKNLCLFIFIVMFTVNSSYAQDHTSPTQLYEWNSSGSIAGELIVAYINSGTIGTYTGASFVGQIVDGTSNWGYTMPIVANFKLYINFSGSNYSLMQDVVTPDITLEIKSISATQVAIVANCPNLYKQSRLFLRYTNGMGPTVTMGDPTVVNSSGTMLISQPTYGSALSGAVVIGDPIITRTAYTLNVGGSSRFNQITVNTTGADFVFDADYKLSTLPALKDYVDRNHHLPEIPSAAEMQKNGLDIGENQVKLLQKVEELTLYMINKNEQLADEKETNNKQQKEIEKQVATNKKLEEQLKSQQQQLDQLKAQMNTMLKQ